MEIYHILVSWVGHLVTFYLPDLQTGCFDLDGVDEAYEFLRLKQSMDMVGFSSDTQRK